MRTYPQMSQHQRDYVEFIADHPGCSIADIVRGCKVNPRAGHRWIYDGVHRLMAQGLVRCEQRGNRFAVYVVEK